jgi:hypothetical protein
MGASNGPEYVTTLISTFLAALRPGDRPVMSVYFRPTVHLLDQLPAAIAVLGMSPDSQVILEKYRTREDQAMRLAKPKKRHAEIMRAAHDLIRVARPLLDGKPLAKRGAGKDHSGGNGIALPILSVRE